MNRLVKTRKNIFLIGLMAISIMFITDYYIQPGYLEKSIVKILCFLILPSLFIRRNKVLDYRDFFKIGSVKQLLGSIFLGLLVYGFIIGCYILLKRYIDLKNIETILSSSLRVNKDNFLYIALYISFLNSLLEEYFFRGFLFLGLKKLGNTWAAYLISALLFAIYHLAIMANWFDISLYSLAILGLLLAGLIFNGLNHKGGNIYNSWLVHMFANFAINTVGLMMFSII